MSQKSEHVKKWRRKSKERIVTAFGGKCCICNYTKCFDALELHHLNPAEKEFSFGGVRANPKSWNIVVEELRKCIMLCSNCHKEIHNGITMIPENAPRFDEYFSDYKKFENEKLFDICPICGNKKRLKANTCSLECAAKKRGTVDWESIDLMDLIRGIYETDN